MKVKINYYVRFKKLSRQNSFFEASKDLEKKLELAEKILPLTNGYTLKHIEESFQSVLLDLKTGFIINLED